MAGSAVKRRMAKKKLPDRDDGHLEEQRRRQLVTAVVQCITEEGFERATTRNIADRAGVSIGMLNYYFQTKKDLVAEAIRHANEGVREALASADAIPFGPGRLEFVLKRTLRNEYPQALPLAFRLAVMAAAVNDPILQKEVCRWMEDGRSKFERSIAAGIEAGTYHPDADPRLLSALLYGAMTGLAVQAAACPKQVTPDLAVEASLLLLRLFTAKAPAPQRAGRGDRANGGSVPDLLESQLLEDSALSPADAMALASAFRALYRSFVSRSTPGQ